MRPHHDPFKTTQRDPNREQLLHTPSVAGSIRFRTGSNRCLALQGELVTDEWNTRASRLHTQLHEQRDRDCPGH